MPPMTPVPIVPAIVIKVRGVSIDVYGLGCDDVRVWRVVVVIAAGILGPDLHAASRASKNGRSDAGRWGKHS